MTLVTDTIDAEIATLERVVEPPTSLAYGRDLSCVTDLVLTTTGELAEVEPATRAAIGEALARRLITPRGALIDDADYGFDVRGYCNRGIDADGLRELSARIRSEVTKDDRVDDVTVAVSYNAPTSTLAIRLQIAAVDPALGTFALTFTVSNESALLESI